MVGKPFKIETDHDALTFIDRMKLSSNGRLARWALFLQDYKYEIVYKKGATFLAADALSRIPREEPVATETRDELVAAALKSDEHFNRDRVVIEFDVDDETGKVATVTNESNGLPTLDDLKLAVKSCPDFKHIYDYLDSVRLPKNDDIARRTAFESNEYELHEGMLYHIYSPRTKRIERVYATIRQVCVPLKYRETVAYELHSMNGHPGFDRLYSLVKSRFFGPTCIHFCTTM